jgi:phosphotransferase system enzyme I (PtsI)
MLALHGTGVSQGISIGKAYVLRREQADVSRYRIPQQLLEQEIQRFQRAVDSARAQLRRIRTSIPSDAPPETASLIDTHLLMLNDAMICEAPLALIREQQRNAEWALKLQRDDLSGRFERMDDPYLRAKRIDVEQVIGLVLHNLLEPHSTDQEVGSAGQILVTNDLMPADAVMLTRMRIKAFVTDVGGPISHTAILARSLSVPAIVSLHNATAFLRTGDHLIVDGDRGVLIAGSHEGIIGEYRRRRHALLRTRRELAKLRGARAVTRDRQSVTLLANIELPADLKVAARVGASGIGLYRTEYLFMNRLEPPAEEEQYRSYARVVKAFADRPVTIRTLDLAADRQVDGASVGPGSTNPALGLRAVRLCLRDMSLFRPQLRAILRASAHGKVRMMIPMLSSLEELFHVLALIEDTKRNLAREGKGFNRRIAIGGMIEVPAAAVCADLFAAHLDFLSIGTNDLIQYTLAIDRLDDSVSYLYDPLHPSVLRLIQGVIEAAKAAQIPVAMCGEMAGDPRCTRLLLGMGLTEFSMHPSMLPQIKNVVRHSELSRLRRSVRKIMRARDSAVLRKLVDEINKDTLGAG